jgi:putative ABC transport system permease protein
VRPGSRSADRAARTALGVRAVRFRARDALRESTLSVARHPARSLMTAIGTVLGAAAFVATLGIGSTMGRQVSDSFDVRRATEVRVTAVDAGLDGSWQADDRVQRLRRLNGVASAGRRIAVGERPVSKLIDSPGLSLQVTGVDPGALGAIGPHMTVGRTYDQFHESRALPVALLPTPVAEQLGITQVGVAIFIADRTFTVMGIFDDVVRRPETMANILIPATVADGLVGGGQPERDILIATAPGAAQLIGVQAPFALLPESPSDLRAVAPPDPRSLRREIEQNVTRSSLILSIMALIIGAVSIANSATASITTRIPEIGLRRAIGARPAHIFAQLVGETTVLGTMGGLTGVVLGVVTTAVVSLLNHWEPVLDLRLAAGATAASAAAGLLAGLFPAARATRIQPVAALQR